MNKLSFLKEADGISFYSYKPSFSKIYYPCYKAEDIPPYFSRKIHKLRMLRELYKSKYQVIYMMRNDAVVGHLVVGRGGSRIAMSTKKDIVIGPIWVIPSLRSHGYASTGIRFVLHEMGLDYEDAYEYIEKVNTPSIRTVEKNGFEFIDSCDEYGLFKAIRPCADGRLNVYRIKNPRSS